MTVEDLIAELKRHDPKERVMVQTRVADELGDDEYEEVQSVTRETALQRPMIVILI